MKGYIKNRGWIVTFSGTGINLALGILYTWSIFKEAIKKSIETGQNGGFNWNLSSLNDPYAVCCLIFAFMMILAGRCQDRYGPRLTAFLGGILVGAGFIIISRTTNYFLWIIGFGVLVGTGIGFGYSSATPPALKWFPPSKTGLIAGLVVSGFGLASVYIAPLSKYLLGLWGLQGAMTFFAIAFLIVVCSLSLMLVNPPPGFSPVDTKKPSLSKKASNPQSFDFKPLEMMRSSTFYVLWLIYFIGAGAGLMVIGSISGMAQKGLGEWAFLAVAILAIGNAGGRIVAGFLSDKIGRITTLFIMLSFQALLMFIAIAVVSAGNPLAILVLSTLIGFNYGTNLSLFPSLTKDLWGLAHFGINYGIVFTAWGVGGFFMGRLSQMLNARTGSFTSSFVTAGSLLVLGAILTILLGKKRASKKIF